VAVGGYLGGNLAHDAGSPEFNAVIFDFHAGYISRQVRGFSRAQRLAALWRGTRDLGRFIRRAFFAGPQYF
jgi:hypothetical protein